MNPIIDAFERAKEAEDQERDYLKAIRFYRMCILYCLNEIPSVTQGLEEYVPMSSSKIEECRSKLSIFNKLKFQIEQRRYYSKNSYVSEKWGRFINMEYEKMEKENFWKLKLKQIFG